MARQPESRLQLNIQKAIRAAFPDAYVRKIHVSEFQSGGIADLLACIPAKIIRTDVSIGVFFAIEVKMPGEQPSELQKLEARDVSRAAGITFVATDVKETITRIRLELKARGLG